MFVSVALDAGGCTEQKCCLFHILEGGFFDNGDTAASVCDTASAGIALHLAPGGSEQAECKHFPLQIAFIPSQLSGYLREGDPGLNPELLIRAGW